MYKYNTPIIHLIITCKSRHNRKPLRPLPLIGLDAQALRHHAAAYHHVQVKQMEFLWEKDLNKAWV
jgi:hypothetical protein